MDTKSHSNSASVPAQSRPNWKLTVGIVGGVVLVLAIICAVIFLLTRNPALTANLRDIAIITFATIGLLLMIVLGALMIVLVYYMQTLVVLLRTEIKPVLMSVNQTVKTVSGTTTMVSDNLSKPLIKFASFMAGLQGAKAAFTAKVDNHKKED